MKSKLEIRKHAIELARTYCEVEDSLMDTAYAVDDFLQEADSDEAYDIKAFALKTTGGLSETINTWIGLASEVEDYLKQQTQNETSPTEGVNNSVVIMLCKTLNKHYESGEIMDLKALHQSYCDNRKDTKQVMSFNVFKKITHYLAIDMGYHPKRVEHTDYFYKILKWGAELEPHFTTKQ